MVAGVTVGAAVVFFILVHWFYPGGLPGFSKTYADQAGVFGLAVSLIGFFLTLWALWETERVNAEARRRVEAAANAARDAVRQAQEEGRKILQGAALRLLASEIRTLLQMAKGAQDLIERCQWGRVIERCGEAKILALRLQHSPHLSGDDKTGLVRGSTGLASIAAFLQERRVADGNPREDLPMRKRAPLETLVNLAASVEGRLLAESFKF